MPVPDNDQEYEYINTFVSTLITPGSFGGTPVTPAAFSGTEVPTALPTYTDVSNWKTVNDPNAGADQVGDEEDGSMHAERS